MKQGAPPKHDFISQQTEMDKVEARAEEYPITQAFIHLLTTLAPSLLSSTATPTEAPASLTVDLDEAFSRLVHFTVETIFLKHTLRAYRRPNERVSLHSVRN